MLRSTLAGVAAGTLMVVGLPHATAGSSEYGRVWRDDGVLRTGCHAYKYHYRAKPRTDVWALETILVDPTGEKVASDVLASGADRKRGTSKFRFCEYNTEPGRFKIRGKLTWYVTDSESRVRWVKPGYFRLRKDRS